MIVAVVGTRPEVIKMAPVVRALRALGLVVSVLLTSQHADANMMGSFLARFELDVDDSVQRRSRGLMGSFVEILDGLGQRFTTMKPELVLAVGDTTTVLATALAARKTGCAFGHIEAGLRAFSRELPEEEHRICADVLADLLFAPTRHAVENLAREHVNGKVVLTGNTVLDALRLNGVESVPYAERRGVLVTIHRQETVDDPVRLRDVVIAIADIAGEHEVSWPLHPRTKANAARFGIELPRTVEVLPPLGRDDFLSRLARARIVVTDSGGVQEEAAILGTPCVIVRRNTERPETIEAGVGRLAGIGAVEICMAFDEVLAEYERYARAVPQLYGDGRAAHKIAGACAEFLAEREDPGQWARRPIAVR